MMPKVTVIYGEKSRTVEVKEGGVLGEAITATGLPLEQPCAGRGTCGKCKILVETGVAPPDEVEKKNLTPGELSVGNRLACRARVKGDAKVVLSPIVVYSNKIFRASNRYKKDRETPLGLAIDLGTTTVAAFVTMLDNGEVCAGAASLNQQTVFGADVISRLAAATNDPANAERLHRLALASINQAVDSLKLSSRDIKRVQKVTIVGNVAMHHLLSKLPLETIAELPFQPYSREAIVNANHIMGGIFADNVQVSLPPLIGGFVGSDALACLAYFDFDRTPVPMVAIDLGTNGEVLVTDGKKILTASTAAGPAFEGVNISCGSRAVDGAVVDMRVDGNNFVLETIADAPPVGLTGSGLLSVINELSKLGLVEPSGRINKDPSSEYASRIASDEDDIHLVHLSSDGKVDLTQLDIREFQKAKGAIRAAVNILMNELGLKPDDLKRVILTGSFGGQVDIEASVNLGMLPPVKKEIVQTIANGAGLGAASFLSVEGFARAERIANQAKQVDLDLNPDFDSQYVGSLELSSNGG